MADAERTLVGPGFSEEALLRSIAQRAAHQGASWPGVLVGPGDDCAVLGARPADEQLLLKVDQLIEGKHVLAGTPLHLVARKAVARVVSDCAAMGGEPTAFLAACVLPRAMSQHDADTLAKSVHAWCEHFGAPCVGGDIARHAGDGPLVLSISALGRVRGAVLRSGAQAGDGVWITGCVGGSYAPLPTARDAFAGGGHHLHFEPRVREGLWLRQALGENLHAMLDVSDGLGIDAGRIARASGVAIELHASALPLRTGQGVGSVEPGATGEAPLSVRQAVRDGEDYELLCTISPRARHAPMPDGLAPLTRIGTVLAASEAQPAGSVWLVEEGGSVRVDGWGWDG